MPDLRAVIGIVAFIFVVSIFLSQGVDEVIEDSFKGIQPDNPTYSSPMTPELLSFIIVFGLAAIFALRLIEK